MGGDPATGGAGAQWIEAAVEGSLRRLGTDHIDLYQQHFPDPDVPVEETLGALDRLVRAGKIRYHGVCNLPAAEVEARYDVAARDGLAAPVSMQDRYNLLRQEAREELFPVVRSHDMAFLPYFPLASGMLSGKYRKGQPLPSDSRFARHLPAEQATRIIERDGEVVQHLEEWATARGHGVAELAIAWLAAQPEVTSVIAGVTKPEQVVANADAAEWQLTPDEVDEVAGIVRAG
jgi:aryl-alcohol dehydrogenase-like predicted oxidoreductase